jgi:thiamine biosynthesis lipoprotein
MSPTETLERPATAIWGALGSTVVLRVTNSARLPSARAAVERDLAAIDLACSRFRADSELSRVNAQAGRVTEIGALLMEAVALALRAAELTGGDVDPTVGRALELAGYDRDWSLLDPPTGAPPGPVSITARTLCGWETVVLDPGNSTIRLPAAVKLDLGATAKAWAADRAARAAAEAAGCGVLVGVGGDLATYGTSPATGWEVKVADDHRADLSAPGQCISIRAGGLATSSTAVRRWSHAGQTMNHIIEPLTGAPVRGTWRTVSVAAASCIDANIATTAALIRAAAAPRWLEDLGLPARLVSWDGSVTTSGGWPPERHRPTPRETWAA